MSTYTPIASQTLSSAAASVTFSNIPQGYTDLVMVTRMASSNTATQYGGGFTINNDSLSIGKISFTNIYGNGSSAVSFRWTTSTSSNVTVPSTTGATSLNAGGMSVININNYSNTTTYKSILTRSDLVNDTAFAWVTLWQDKSAIDKITFYPNDGTNTILAGSTFAIYGIQVGDVAQKAQGGNIVVNSGGYMYHAFTSSGYFVPNQSLSADILVVGAGGGGGAFHGGGGGGGAIEGSGFFQTQSLSAANNYLVAIGAGGAGGTAGGRGNNGGNSLFGGTSTITALGGGAGGSAYVVPNAGGSGGGTGQTGHSAGTASGSNTNAGGTSGGSNQVGGGGGGATAAGTNGSGSSGGAGGEGKTLTTIDTNFTALGFAGIVASSGGGGGASGGSAASGGTGAGAGTNSNTAGGNATSFGSGGGGGGYTTGDGGNGGNGYSGLVIIRYTV